MLETISAFWAQYGDVLIEGSWETLLMVSISTVLSYVIGVPLGVALIVTQPQGIRPHRVVYGVLGWIVNIGRSLPFAILLVALMPFTRALVGTAIGVKGAIPPLVISAAPFVARMVETSLSEVDAGVVAEQGKVEDIFSHPSTDAARRLVYPGGVSLEQYPAGTRAVRVAFNGGTAYQPLIASLAIDLGIKVNILGADTREIDGKAFGTMLLGLPDDPNDAAKALSYIRSQPNVSAEEVEYHA